jgi:hypothetical protein
MEDSKKLIETVLISGTKEIAFEPIPEENESPLAHPVVEKATETNSSSDTKTNSSGNTETQSESKPKEKPTDAPEQEIDAEPEQEEKGDGECHGEAFSMPLEHAGMMADSIIGTFNNTVLEIGGGYFVTIRKHKDFYDFEEVIQVIDEQNVKNVKRLKLDEEDKALIRPLLIHILRKKAAALSPEKQLLMVVLSIIIKKGKAVMEIRSENEILVERIRNIIRKEMGEANNETNQETYSRDDQKADEDNSHEERNPSSPPENKTGLPGEAYEVLD